MIRLVLLYLALVACSPDPGHSAPAGPAGSVEWTAVCPTMTDSGRVQTVQTYCTHLGLTHLSPDGEEVLEVTAYRGWNTPTRTIQGELWGTAVNRYLSLHCTATSAPGMITLDCEGGYQGGDAVWCAVTIRATASCSGSL